MNTQEKLTKILELKLKRDAIDCELEELLNPSLVQACLETPKYKNIPDGWTIESDQAPIKIKKLTFVSILKDGESYLDGSKLQERAKELKGFMGLSEAEYLLDNQDFIPKSIQDNYIVFPATVLRDSSGRRRVAFLRWDGGQWVVGFCWLGRGFVSSARVACSE